MIKPTIIKLIPTDYIPYLMIIPSIAPILYLTFNNDGLNLITFYGGFYLLTCLILFFLFLYKHKLFISSQNEIIFSKKALIIFFIAIFISLSYSLVSKYLAFQLQGSDAAIFISMIKNISSGNFGYASSAGFYHLGRHQNYILFLLAIIYLISFKSIIPILICNAGAIFIAGILLYKITRLYFNQLIALIVAFTFYASPITSAFSGFYPEIYYVMALPLLFYVCITQKHTLYIILATLFLLCIKEEAVLYMPGFLFILWKQKRLKLLIILAALSLAIALINITIVAPYFFNKNTLLGVNLPNLISTFFTKWGTDYTTVVINIITHPIDFITYCFDENSGFWPNYIYWWFLPLLSPFVLLSSMLIIFLDGASSDNMDLHQMTNYHSFGVGTIAFIGMIIIFHQIITRYPKYKKQLQTFLLFIMLCHPFTYINYSGFISQLNNPQIPSINTFMRVPIDFLWWRAYYKINWNDINDFNMMTDFIEQNYTQAPKCVGSSIYNPLLNTNLLNIQKLKEDSLYQDKCIITFGSGDGVNQPMTQEDITNLNILMQRKQCQIFGKFYVCNNLI